MKEYQVKLYQPEDFSVWNSFINEAKNATFLFHRNFMEYHKDRFEDYSLMVFEDKKLVAVLPANKVGDEVHSHQGLSYGGLVLENKAKLQNVITMFKQVLVFLNQNELTKLYLKLIPSIYCDYFSDELSYCLFITNAQMYRRDTLSVIDLKKPFEISKGRLEGVKKGEKSNLIIKEEKDFELFWNRILIPNLQIKHQVKPVHSLEEINKLKSYFPNEIRQFNVYKSNEIVAGATVFESKNVVHIQYISGDSSKSENGSLDFLHHFLITEKFRHKNYFDFGVSNEEQGKKLNVGLCFWKDTFGAKTLVQDFYKVDTQNYNLLDANLI